MSQLLTVESLAVGVMLIGYATVENTLHNYYIVVVYVTVLSKYYFLANSTKFLVHIHEGYFIVKGLKSKPFSTMDSNGQ